VRKHRREVLYVICGFSVVALPVNRLRYVSYGAGSAQGRPVAAALYPGLRPATSPLRGAFDLSLQASGRAEAASVQNTALSPHPCGLPRPSGNVSAMLRPPAPAVSAAPCPAAIHILGLDPVGRVKRSATRQNNATRLNNQCPAALRLRGPGEPTEDPVGWGMR
jgi:hypothetical protein